MLFFPSFLSHAACLRQLGGNYIIIKESILAVAL